MVLGTVNPGRRRFRRPDAGRVPGRLLMRLLLDTHAFLWWIFDDPRLSSTARDLIANPFAETVQRGRRPGDRDQCPLDELGTESDN